MKLSLQKKINYKSVHEQRSIMIQQENLHMLDSITYEQFLMLYQKYGDSKISEEQFAKYFLDIDWRSFYNLQTGRRETSSILEREFYKDNEFEFIRQKIMSEEGLIPKSKIKYDRLLELYQKYGNRFSLKMFAYEVLNINAHAVDDMNGNSNRETPILREFPQTRAQISKMKANVLKHSGIYMGKKITLAEFEELYETYGTDGIEEKEFALRVLGIQNDFFIRFKKGRSKEATALQSFPVDPKYIELIRKKLIIAERLYIEQPISMERFEELHAKYGSFLSKELFAGEVLDINIASLNNAKQRGYNCLVLTAIEIPDKYVKDLRKKIIIENDIKPNNQMMTLEELRALRIKYAPMLSEYRFVTLIMGIKKENYFQLTAGTTKKNYVFPEPVPTDVLDLRKKIIREEHLHYDDFIDYYRLDELRQKYAPTMREVYFARYILDISQINIDNIRNEKGRSHTRILLDETLPSSKEIEALRMKLVAFKDIKNAESINYASFQHLYNIFGGIMPEDMFALQVMEITQKELNRMKCNEKYKTKFLMEARNEAQQRKSNKNQKLEEKAKQKLERKEEKAKQKKLKNSVAPKAKKAMDDCDTSQKGIQWIQEYIEECELKFKEGVLEPNQLKLYADAIFFIEAEGKHIEHFAQACISFEEYDFGSRCISRNLEYNEHLNDEDKIKLSKLRDTMRYAVKKQKAVVMIARGITDIDRIIHMTGIMEVDVLEIMNRMQAEKRAKNFPETLDED